MKSTLVGKLTGPPVRSERSPNDDEILLVQWAYHHCQHLSTNHDQPRSRPSFMKTWTPSSPFFSALIHSSFLATLMRELAVTALPGKWQHYQAVRGWQLQQQRPITAPDLCWIWPFEHKHRFPPSDPKNRTSWMHPRSKHWHLIDCVIIKRKRDRQDVRVTSAVCGAECWTDHRLITPSSASASSPRDVHRAKAWTSTS